MLRILMLFAVLSCSQTVFAQALNRAIATHEKEVEKARQIVIDKFQTLILQANKKNDLTMAAKYQEWNQAFVDRGMMFMPDGTDMAVTYKKYGAALKASADTLRAAYLKEIEALTKKKDYDAANQLTRELESRRLPLPLVSLQMQTSNRFVNHWAYLLRGGTAIKEGEKMNATWELRPGLHDPAFVSIHAVNAPTAYVDHFGFRVRLADYQEDNAWKHHATWIQEPGLADPAKGVSFKAATHQNRYLRIRSSGEAWLDPYENNIGYKKEATFYIKPGLSRLW